MAPPSPDDAIIIDEMSFQEVSNIEQPDTLMNQWVRRALPDDWKQQHHMTQSGVYQTVLSLNIPPNRLWAVYIPSVNMNVAVYLNGHLLGQGGQFKRPMARNLNRPLYYSIPNGLLRSGDNRIEVRLKAGLAGEGLIGRIYLGPQELMQSSYQKRYFMRVTTVLGITASMLILGILLGSLWAYRRDDKVYGWVALIAIMWSIHNLNLLIVDVPFSTEVWNWLVHSSMGWTVIAMIIASHRLIGITPWKIERILLYGGIILSILLAIFLLATEYYPVIKQVWNSLFALLGIYPVMRTYLAYRKTPNIELPFIIMAGMIILTFGAHDWQVEMGLWDRTGGYILQYASPVLLFVFVSIVIRRFVCSLNEQEILNRELEQRIALKHQELQENHEKLRHLEQEKILVEERERIMRDMHDGVGGHLVSALALMEGDEPSPEKIKATLKDGLNDLRMMIDSLDPVEDDLSTVLGLWRSRVEPVLTLSNIRFNWQVSDLPKIDDFGPQKILHVLRILQETMTNTLKHAQASTIRVSTELYDNETKIRLEIKDDGIGFTSANRQGRGLLNMQSRARQISATVTVHASECGTTVCLVLPLKR